MSKELGAADQAKAREIARAMAFYLTPFVLVLVAMAALATGLHTATITALVLVVFTTLVNFALLGYLRRHPAKAAAVRMMRIGFNYLFNIPIVYMLWPFWPPIWLLLLPSVAAVALAEDRRTTIGTAGLFTVVLLYVLHRHGDPGWYKTCEMAMYIVTIWTVGLLVNRLERKLSA